MPTIQKVRREPIQQMPPGNVAQFSVEQYHAMIDAGVFDTDRHYELLNGWIVKKMTTNPPHATCVRCLNRLFSRILDDDWALIIQDPITVSDSEPEPDLAVAYGGNRGFRGRHAGPGEVELVIEVADTSLADDLTRKLPIYAAARIPQYWVVNLNARCVEVFTLPRGGKSPVYRQHVTVPEDGDIAVSLRGQVVGTVSVREFLP